eukprot:3128971-Prymnesium_polylepis.1
MAETSAMAPRGCVGDTASDSPALSPASQPPAPASVVAASARTGVDEANVLQTAPPQVRTAPPASTEPQPRIVTAEPLTAEAGQPAAGSPPEECAVSEPIPKATTELPPARIMKTPFPQPTAAELEEITNLIKTALPDDHAMVDALSRSW